MLESGEILSHYKIVSAIGAGGMGEVYLADDTKLGRQVALKVLLSEVSGDKDRVSRFIQEAKAASALNHPNILTVFEIGNFDGSEYMATEFIKGETLRQRMKNGSFGLGDALEIALQITAALGAAHEAGIIHRDIKPENIMIRDDGLVKVLDFGLAKLLPSSSASVETTLPQLNTKPGMLVGTVAYMSPEQARGRTIDPRSDIFSLGIVMFELFAGKRPFEGESHLDLISSILKDEPPSLRTLVPDLPRQLERIVEKSLRKDRDHRFQHIKDLNIDIEDLLDELKFEAKLNRSVPPTVEAKIHQTNQDSLINTQSNLRSALTTSISKTRRFTLLHAVIFLLLASVVVGAVWYLRPASSSVSVAEPYKTAEIASWNSAPGELFSSASFSPDGKLIAFASTKSGTKGIWVTQTTSTDAIQVTKDSFSNTDPIWSPKGDEIAFLSQRPGSTGGSITGIWRVSALGGSPISVMPVDGGSATLRRWTPTGRVYYEMLGELYCVEVANGTSRRVTSLGDSKVKWVNISPDEKTIAYATGGDEEWRILSSDVSGANPVDIAKGSGKLDRSIAWLPEKKRLFFTTISDSGPQLFKTTTGSLQNQRIAAPTTESSVVDIAFDGRSIILSSAKEESNLWRVNTANGAESPVARDLNAKLWPTVSPDGGRVVYQSIKNLSAGNKLLAGNIVVRPLSQGSDADRPVTLSESGFLPAWSPDSTSIAFLKITENRTDLFSVNADGGGEKPITSLGKTLVGYSISPYNTTQARAFDWSPDSSRIAYVGEKNGVSNVWSVSPRDGSQVQITSNQDSGTFYNCLIWSPDGTRIAFSYRKSGKDDGGKIVRGVKVLNIQAGSVIDVLETSRVIRMIGWTADETAIVIAEASKDNSGLPPETNLSRVAVASGIETSIVRLKNIYFYNIFLSKDRKQISFAAREQELDNLWLIPSVGGTAKKLTANNDSGLNYSRLAWLPDGGSIIVGKQTRFSLLSIMTDIE